MLPIIYGTGWSFGKIQALLVAAEAKAAEFNGRVDLSRIHHVALDEMFSQGSPVFGGIDLDTGYLFLLEDCPTRTGAEWTEALSALRDEQALHPRVVVKDAGEAMTMAIGACFPDAEQRDDLFHAVRLMGQVAYHFERRAYAAIAGVDNLERKRRRARTEAERRSFGQQLRQAKVHMERAIERFDLFDRYQREARRALALTDRGQGRLHSATEVIATLHKVADGIDVLGGHRAHKVARYLRNRAPGLARYLGALAARLASAAADVGGADVVEAVVRAWQASMEVEQGGPWWDLRARSDELDAAIAGLLARTGRDAGHVRKALATVLPIVAQRHRASSAIENLNSVLRPYLVVHKGVQQGFLDLFRFYWNTRVRQWGPHKGTSAHQLLTGERIEDWVTLLGYPPSRPALAAA